MSPDRHLCQVDYDNPEDLLHRAADFRLIARNLADGPAITALRGAAAEMEARALKMIAARDGPR
jgi:hypothetical protein